MQLLHHVNILTLIITRKRKTELCPFLIKCCRCAHRLSNDDFADECNLQCQGMIIPITLEKVHSQFQEKNEI